MARNQSRDYATMDEDERRRFTGSLPAGEEPQELDFTGGTAEGGGMT